MLQLQENWRQMLDFSSYLPHKSASGGGDGNTAHRSNRNGSLGDRVMAKRHLPSPEDLRQLLVYDQQVGSFIWKKRDASLFTNSGQHTAEHNCRVWNAKYAGSPAGAIDRSVGYLRISVFHRKLWAHRVAWMMVYGEAPNGQIDHINGDKLDNRISNLRVVTMTENRRNQRRPRNNRSGYVGVAWNPKNRNWNARIGVGGRTLHLGSFECIDDAIAARKAGEARVGFHQNHGRADGCGYLACGGEIAIEEGDGL